MGRLLVGSELERALHWMFVAAGVSHKALCYNGQCGAIIVNGDTVIGAGYNAPPQDNPNLRMCDHERIPPRPGYRHDLTCCVHAEIRAGVNALEGEFARFLPGSTMFFTRTERKGGAVIKSGRPYCTLCSRFILDRRIANIALWHEEGITLYDTVEYNKLSFDFKGP